MSQYVSTYRPVKWPGLVLALSLVTLLAACSREPQEAVIVVDSSPAAGSAVANGKTESSTFANEELSPRVLRRFAPLETSTAPPKALADLGRMLYYDTRLSKTNEVSCNTCHPLNKYGATADPVSMGIHGRRGTRNAPSTYNAAGHFVQFWDGRTDTIEKQATMPMENELEMGMTQPEILAVLNGIEGYRAAFEQAFPTHPKAITVEHVGVALGAFERGLVTPARWDRYLRGDQSALGAREKAGAKLFANLGCIVCHTGPYVGGSMFEHVGARVPWPKQKDSKPKDSGRRQVTGNVADEMVFKVPSLRNVAKTAPYFHDGSADTLSQAVRMMARHQLGVELEDDEVAELEAWLGSLTGELPASYIEPPVLPTGT